MELIITITALIALTAINIYTLHSHGKQAQEWRNERREPAQQEIFQNDVATLVSIINANNIGVELRNLVNTTLINRVNLYFNPVVTIKTED